MVYVFLGAGIILFFNSGDLVGCWLVSLLGASGPLCGTMTKGMVRFGLGRVGTLVV